MKAKPRFCFMLALFLLLHDTFKRLDRRERDAVGVDRMIRSIVVSQPKTSVEILRHRTEVANGGRLVQVRPGRDRKLSDPLQDRVGVGGAVPEGARQQPDAPPSARAGGARDPFHLACVSSDRGLR